jgi:hypothetical protein
MPNDSVSLSEEDAVARQITLRYAGTCVHCGASLVPGTSALWDSTARTVQCVRCPDHDATLRELKTENKHRDARARGIAGGSARREYERRRSQRAERMVGKHPRLGRVLLAISDEPQSTRAWSRGAEGEERVARRLERELADRGVVLNDRRLPRSRANIDHLVIGPSGVFTVDTKRYKGKVEKRRVGPLFDRHDGLFVAGRDRTNLVDGARAQAQAVRQALAADERFPVSAVLCFTGSDWPVLTRPFVISDVWIGWPRALTKAITSMAILDHATIDSIAGRLDRAFPPA